MLGKREKSIYGSFTLAQLYESLERLGKELTVGLEFFQSNHEGDLIDKLEAAAHTDLSGMLINLGAYGHTSLAIRDALLACGKPFVEVHISNIYSREDFRHSSYISDIALGVIIGLGMDSYLLGLRGLAAKAG